MKMEASRLPVFREKFRELRGDLTQAQFADKLGLSRPTVGLYESGARIPDAKVLQKIASRCNVSADNLLGLPSCQTDMEPENDPDAAQDSGAPVRFVIDNDGKAEWALKRIKEAEDEHERLIALVEQERAALDEKKARFDAALERDTAFLKDALDGYMRTVKCKESKTQESYQLLSGKLIRKKAGVDFSVDSDALTGWLRESGREDLLAVTVKPMWGEIKKRLTADPESGAVVIAETGEVVEGVTAVEKPETFSIKFN